MDDSNIYYYIILGVIYIISRVLKKKKKEQNEPEPSDVVEEVQSPQPSPRNANTFEDLFKELTGEDFTSKPEPQKEVIPAAANYNEIQNVIQPAPVQPQYHEDDLIDIVPNKQLKRDKPTYERLSSFKMEEEEESSLASEISESLQDEDEIKKAIIYKEIFDRKY